MARIFEKRQFGLPDVDFPDWELIGRLDELFGQHSLAGTLRQFRAFDSRGSYVSDSLAEFRKELEAQDEIPKSVQLSMEANEPATGTYRHCVVNITPTKRGQNLSSAIFSSGDEATVLHLMSRTEDFFRHAGERHERRIAAEKAKQRAAADGQPCGRQASSGQPPWWREYATELIVVIVGTVVAGLIVAAILGLFS